MPRTAVGAPEDENPREHQKDKAQRINVIPWWRSTFTHRNEIEPNDLVTTNDRPSNLSTRRRGCWPFRR